MQYWIISNSNSTNEFLILKESSIVLTIEKEETNIDEAIENKKLSNFKSYRYKDINEIVLNDTDSSIELRLKDDERMDKEIGLDGETYQQIKQSLLKGFKGVDVKNYSVIKQMLPGFVGVIVSIFFTSLTYVAAVASKNGENLSTAGRRGGIKKMVVVIADLLGPIGTLAVGSLIILFFIYLIFRIYRNPKKGQVIKIGKFSELRS